MQSVLEQFPKWRFEIERLYLESMVFRELCQDYEEVRTLVAAWTNTDDGNQAMIDEYQVLLTDLETEIREDLEERFGTAVPPDQNSTSHPTIFAKQEEDEEA